MDDARLQIMNCADCLVAIPHANTFPHKRSLDQPLIHVFALYHFFFNKNVDEREQFLGGGDDIIHYWDYS